MSQRRPIAFDFETENFAPGNSAPQPVCMSYAIKGIDGVKDVSGLVVGEDMESYLERFLDGAIAGKYVLVNFSIAYDFSVALAHMSRLWEKIWLAYRLGAILCTRVREKLLDIGEGSHGGERDHKGKMIKKDYNLGDCILRHFQVELDKGEDSYRTRYMELIDVPLASTASKM